MRTRPTQAFTVIEMMVVISIVAILGAILFPVFARAREKGNQTVCASNLRNVALSLRLYSAEHYGHFPPTSNNLWPLCPKYLLDGEVLQCPTVSVLQRTLPGWQAPGRKDDLPGFPCDYVYRAGLADDRRPKTVVAADDMADRHNDGCNYLFVDGHAKWIKAPGYGGNEQMEGVEGLEELRKLMVQEQWQPLGTPPITGEGRI